MVALVTDTDEDHGSNFHREGFSSGGPPQKIVQIPRALEEPKQIKFLPVLFFLLLLTKQTINI